MKKVLVCGAGGFIGSHLVQRIKKFEENVHITAVDIKRPVWLWGYSDNFYSTDLRMKGELGRLFRNDFDEIYQCAANDGGREYISNPKNAADILNDNLLIDLNILNRLKDNSQTPTIFFASSGEVYSTSKCSEDCAYPANPHSDLGWAKLTSEQLYINFYKHYGISSRIGRLHTVYGPRYIWLGGKENIVYVLCRKLIEAKRLKVDHIEIMGDGKQTRSFIYIEDAVDAILKLTRSNIVGPLNIGSPETIEINELASIIMDLVGYHPMILHTSGATGAHARSSDNELTIKHLKWKPNYNLVNGLSITCEWMKKQYLSYRKQTGVYKKRAECFGLVRSES